MKRVTNIGGVFFKVKDLAATNKWYHDELGFETSEWGAAFTWNDVDVNITHPCSTAWSPFKQDSKHFEPSTVPYMINYRVHDLTALIDALRNEGVQIVGGIDDYDYGKFAWIMDPEGRKIELWEPKDTGFGEAAPPWTGKVSGLAGVNLTSSNPGKTKEWYKKHLGIEDGFNQVDLTSGNTLKVEWNVSDKPFQFSYYGKATETLTDPDGNPVVIKKS